MSASLLNPDWDDPSKFSFDLKFDLGMGEWLSNSPPKLADVAEWLSNLPDLSCITDECEGDKENLFDERAAPVSVLPCTSLGSSNTPKRLRLSLARPSKEVTTTNQRVSRFAVPVDSPEREKAAKGVVSAKTEANTQWALRNFNAWALNRSFMSSAEAVPADLLSSHDAELVCKWLCRFVLETRRTDGSSYPPGTIRSLVSGLNRVLQSNKAPFSVLDKSDHRFRDLLKTLDSLSSELHRQGIGATKNSAKVIDPKHEDVFWQKSLLGFSTPKVLQHTVFFYVGLNFVLRGVQEQYDLVPSQLTRVPQDLSVYDESVYYEYPMLN